MSFPQGQSLRDTMGPVEQLTVRIQNDLGVELDLLHPDEMFLHVAEDGRLFLQNLNSTGRLVLVCATGSPQTRVQAERPAYRYFTPIFTPPTLWHVNCIL